MNKTWLGLTITGGAICLSSILVPTILSVTIFNKNHNYSRGVDLFHVRQGDDLSGKVLHFDKNYLLPYITNLNKNVWLRWSVKFSIGDEKTPLQFVFYAGTPHNSNMFSDYNWEKVFSDHDVNITQSDFKDYQFAAFIALLEPTVAPENCWCFYTKDPQNTNPKWLDNRTDTFTFPSNCKVKQLIIAIDDFNGAGDIFYTTIEHQIIKNT